MAATKHIDSKKSKIWGTLLRLFEVLVLSIHVVKMGQMMDFHLHCRKDCAAAYYSSKLICILQLSHYGRRRKNFIPVNILLHFELNYFIISDQSPELLAISSTCCSKSSKSISWRGGRFSRSSRNASVSLKSFLTLLVKIPLLLFPAAFLPPPGLSFFSFTAFTILARNPSL